MVHMPDCPQAREVMEIDAGYLCKWRVHDVGTILMLERSMYHNHVNPRQLNPARRCEVESRAARPCVMILTKE